MTVRRGSRVKPVQGCIEIYGGVISVTVGEQVFRTVMLFHRLASQNIYKVEIQLDQVE